MKGTDFRKAKGVNPVTLKEAKNYQDALYAPDVVEKLKLDKNKQLRLTREKNLKKMTKVKNAIDPELWHYLNQTSEPEEES